ncbi:hypothetical protein [Bilophila wadsworthia]|uniref:hypothetical protein n=1 Tax=Bilophila wadsworthia TaxID=35833 RepID=UPI00242F8C32|nr:hypothetical protein [Bilophila wadsworthia]
MPTTTYLYEEKEYASLRAVRQDMNVSFPPDPDEDLLANLGVTVKITPDPEPEPEPPAPEPTLEEMKAAKLAEINRVADMGLAVLTLSYPSREISTFDKQESEARAYTADATASTPLLSALATARGILLPDLVGRVLAKADAFAVASGTIIGWRQGVEDRLDACATKEEVAAITVSTAQTNGGSA